MNRGQQRRDESDKKFANRRQQNIAEARATAEPRITVYEVNGTLTAISGAASPPDGAVIHGDNLTQDEYDVFVEKLGDGG